MNNFLIISNILLILGLCGVIFMSFKIFQDKRDKKILDEEGKKKENEQFEELKRTVTERLENVSNSYNTFSNKITKDITDSFTRYEKDVKNFNEKVQNMNEVQSNLTKIFSAFSSTASASSCLASIISFLSSDSSASFILSKMAAGKKESTATKTFLGNLIANSTVP